MCVEGSWGAGESRDEYDQDTLCICMKISNNIRKKTLKFYTEYSSYNGKKIHESALHDFYLLLPFHFHI